MEIISRDLWALLGTSIGIWDFSKKKNNNNKKILKAFAGFQFFQNISFLKNFCPKAFF